MKFLIFISLLHLELVLLVSSQSLPEEIFQLISSNLEEQNAAEGKLSLLATQTKNEINKQFKQKVLPTLDKIYEDTETYIQALENQTSASGYNSTRCIESTKDIFKSGILLNVTEKASREIKDVFEVLISNIQLIGISNIKLISKEVDSISEDFRRCTRSEAPAYCNGTLYKRVLTKQEEIPNLYNKEIQKSNLTFIQHVVSYENRAEDYATEAIKSIKPYLTLIESCVSTIFDAVN